MTGMESKFDPGGIGEAFDSVDIFSVYSGSVV